MKKVSNQEWQKRKQNAIARGEANVAPIYIDHAKNAEMWDVEGKRYIDFGTGIAVCNTGHSHPQIIEAVKKQIDKFSHSCVMVTPYDSAVLLAESLNKLAPGSSEKKSMFVTTGSEAVENAIKIARAYTKRPAVIAFNGGYHGRTNFTLGLTGKNVPYKTLFGPFPGDIYRASFPIDYHDISIDDSVEALQKILICDVSAQNVAAIIIEPIQGEGGFYPAPKAFLQAIRKLCDKHGIVMIVDEIQTGFARTGKFYCIEHSQVEPDLITSAKGMAGGYPLAAVIGKKEIMDAPLPGGLGGTYAGSPVGCAAALAVIDIIEKENLLAAAQRIGSIFKQRLLALKEKHPKIIGDVRADHGAMIALELICDGDINKPNTDLITKIMPKAYQNGLVLLSCGIRNNVFRFLPALTISDEIINEGLDIFTHCLEESLSEN